MCACVTCGGWVSVNTDSRTCAGLWVWPTRGPGRFSSLWVAGICPWNLRSLRFRPGPRFAKHVICTCPQLPLGKLRTPGKEVVLAALCRLRGAEHLAQGHTAAGSDQPGRFSPGPVRAPGYARSLTTDRQNSAGRPGHPEPPVTGLGASLAQLRTHRRLDRPTPPPPRIQQPGRADSAAGKEGLSTVHVWGRRASLRGDRHSRTHAPIAHAHR